MSKLNFFQPVYNLEGQRLSPVGSWDEIFLWNSACWDRSIPKDCTRLTYLDVGCCEGLYLLYFELSKGDAFGLDFFGTGVCSFSPQELGKLYDFEQFKYIRDMYKAQYVAQVGGILDGKIIPKPDRKFNIVSCMNTIEYVDKYESVIDELFKLAEDRVIICTETSLDKPTYYASYMNARCINVDELMAHMSRWPLTVWTLKLYPPNDVPHYEVFIVATNPKSLLPPIDSSAVAYSFGVTVCQQNRGRKI
jgi:hypothetical protein